MRVDADQKSDPAFSHPQVCIEALKLIQGKDKLSDYRQTSDSLAINQYLIMEPAEPKQARAHHDVVLMEDVTPKPDKFTKWDRTVISGPLTVSQFVEVRTHTQTPVESNSCALCSPWDRCAHTHRHSPQRRACLWRTLHTPA